MPAPESRLALSSLPALLLGVMLALGPAGSAAARGDMLPGPVGADVVRVIDGDTFVADAHIWPGQMVRVSVRIRGIDAPEMRSRCAAERRAARRSREALQAMLSGGPVEIRNIGGGKYYGRVLADVVAPDGSQVATSLLQRRLARVYRGGRRVHYCG